MIAKTLSEITIDDIRALVADSVSEGRRLEFKEELHGNSDSEKREFLYDISSLANAAGGDLIFGVSESDGIASAVPGLEGFVEDKDVLRLETSIRDGVDARIPGIQWRTIEGGDKGPVLIARVPRSWIGPHMVTLKNASRFYTRGSKGKFQMDVSQLRDAFDGTSEIPRRIERWRDDRLSKVIANDGPVALQDGPRLIMQLVPLASFASEWTLNATEISNLQTSLKPLGSSGWDHRINVDGFLTFSKDRDRPAIARCYTQLFRSGRIEAVTSDIVREIRCVPKMASIWYEKTILQATDEYLKTLKSLDIQMPLVFLLSITGGKGIYMTTDGWMSGYDSVPLDRDLALFPDVLIESYEADLPKALRPAFDSVWNACGIPQSLNYDSDGNWNPK